MNFSVGALILIMLVAMLSPGPDFILVLKNARLGFNQGIATALGISAGLVVHCSLALAGVAVLLTTSRALYLIVRLGGAAFLTYLGLKILFSLRKGNLHQIESDFSSKSPSIFRCFCEGLITNVLNPKVTLFILSIFTQFIPPDAPLADRIYVASVMLAECILVWSSFGALVQLNVFQRNLERFGKYLEAIFGAALVGLGVKIAVQEI